MRILLDVMGGDLPPDELVRGGVSAAARRDIDILFAGDPPTIERALASAAPLHPGRFEILPATQVIAMDDPPVRSAREKPDSSLVRGLLSLRDGRADAFVSPGNTGAIVAASILHLGRIAGIPRPALLASLPTLGGPEILLLDVGATSDCTPDHLLHFAGMGVTYARAVAGIPHPTVGLLNIGTERGKGNRLIADTYDLLERSPLPFAGNVEAHQLMTDRPVDVAVCDGFVGNIFLKSTEGGVAAVTGLLKSSIRARVWTQLGALLLRGAFRRLRETLAYQRRGGAPLLGVDGVVIIAHGRSDAEAIDSAIEVACRQVEAGLTARLSHGLSGWGQDGG